jgi:hypothetical protein
LARDEKIKKFWEDLASDWMAIDAQAQTEKSATLDE